MDVARRGSSGLGIGLAASARASLAEAAGNPAPAERPVVVRVWQGRVSAEKVEACRQVLFEAGKEKVAATPGDRGVQMCVAARDGIGDFTMSSWDSTDAIRGCAGADYTRAHDLPRDRESLIEPEALSHRFDVDVVIPQA